MTFSQKVIGFIEELHYTGGPLPKGIRVMNPYKESPGVMPIVKCFYDKYYNDNHPRHLILGINPGRFGGGMTGIPFTDPKRLKSECGLEYNGKITHEPSSVFVYDMINAFGGSESFYSRFYINSPCPLGFTSISREGKETNYNYYDSKELLQAVEGFIIESIYKLCNLGVETGTCFCFGTGENFRYLDKINREHRFFKKLVPLEHPRYIMQYKSASKKYYIDKYLEAFRSVD